jgi:hypothetical protein
LIEAEKDKLKWINIPEDSLEYLRLKNYNGDEFEDNKINVRNFGEWTRKTGMITWKNGKLMLFSLIRKIGWG